MRSRRSLRLARVGGLLTLTCALGLALAGPAYAGLHNAHPADAFGDPADVFVDNEALFAYTTSDIKGGYVCVVHANAPVDANCDGAIAWGDKNRVVGIGTQYTLLEGGDLSPGYWRLQTVDSQGENGEMGGEFTVIPCEPGEDPDGCTTSLSAQAVADAKASAQNLGLPLAAGCIGYAVQDIASAGTAARSSLKNYHERHKNYRSGAVGFRATVYPLLPGIMGLNFSLPSFDNPGEEKAKEILKDLVCSLTEMYADIAADPPDPAFTTIAQPTFGLLPTDSDATSGALMDALDTQTGYGETMLKGFERYQGAVAAGVSALPFQHAQAGAVGGFGQLQVRQMRAAVKALRAQAAAYDLDSKYSVPVVTAARRAELVDVYARVRTTGFTFEELAQLTALGMTSGQIEDARSQFSLDPSLLPVDTTLPTILRDAATALENAIPKLEAFVRNASVVAGRTNIPPTASFTATPASGEPPLAVSFDSTSTSSDLDELTYAWDFGDGESASGPTATHTYATAGSYVATLTVSDGLDSATATRTISVGVAPPANRPPVAVNDTLITDRNTAGTVDVLANDTDPDGDALTLMTSYAFTPHGGVAVCDLDAGTCTYTPPLGYTGPDSFDYVVRDAAEFATATVSITVVDTPNTAPVAVDDALVVERQSFAFVNALANDSDPDSDPLQVVSWTQPSHGSSFCSGGSCGYSSEAEYFGPDSFTYTIEDGRGGTATGTIAVTVEANRSPVAVADGLTVAQDVPNSLSVLANDTDADGDALEVAEWGDADNGSVACTAAGVCTYTPDAGFVGSDSYEYTASDPGGKTAKATVVVTVVDPLAAGADWVWRRGRPLEFEPTIVDPTSSTHSCTWSFGDGATGSECEFDHAYAEEGVFHPEVEVAFTNGLTLTETVKVTVIAPESGETADEELGDGVTVVGTDVSYTKDADFDQGTLLNVNHDAPNGNQLQLNARAKPFPFVNIAASARGTIVRIAADTGEVLGEYLTAPDGMARNPSRTTVDQLGNVWVANRDEGSDSGGRNKGSVARVGLVLGGTRVDATGTPAPEGEFLKPPFRYSTCVDRDGDGLLFTSRGLLDSRPWPNDGGVDSHGGVSTASDECVINYTRVRGTATRSIAVDANNDVWVSGTGNNDFEKLDGATGLPVPGSQFNLGCGGYGALIDGHGVLWGATNLLRYDTGAEDGACLPINGYGLSVDPQTGHIWMSNGGQVMEIDSDGTLLGTFDHGSHSSQGLAVDGSGGVWVTHSLGGTSVGHVRTDGALVGVVPTAPGPTGVAVDTRGKIWSANISGSAQRIDPAIGRVGPTGSPAGWVDLTADLGSSSGPYNYSDMTGFVSIGTTARTGFWRIVQDAGTAGADWSRITWNSEGGGAGGGAIELEARAADSAAGLTDEPFAAVANGTRLSLAGRFIEVRATLRRGDIGAGPVLTDLRIRANRAPTASDVAATVDQGVPKPVTLVGADPDDDALSYEIVAQPAHGTLSGTGAARVYTPAPGYAGPDSFTYRVSDGKLASAPATVRITVAGAAAPPPPPPPAPSPPPAPPPPPPPPPPPRERETRVDGYRCSIVGTPGPDVLRGTTKDDVICGLAGNDVLYGLGGNDVLFGGLGQDRLYGAGGRDLARGSPGADTIVGGAGNDRLDGGVGNDRVLGEAGNDTLRGRTGNDVLDGAAGSDKLDGHQGNDRLLGGAGKDRILGGPGSDRLDAGSGADNVLLGDAGDDFLLARNGLRDRLSGGAGRDRARVDPVLDLAAFIEQLLG